MSGLSAKEARVAEIPECSLLPGLWCARPFGQPSCLWLVPGILSTVPHSVEEGGGDMPDLWELYDEPRPRG